MTGGAGPAPAAPGARRFRAVAEFLAEGAPKPAERMLIERCRNGRDCVLNGGVRPDRRPPSGPEADAVTIRAELLRLIITGGSPDCGFAEAGVYLAGARIEGRLDLSFGRARGMTTLTDCVFEEEIVLLQARLNRLSLHGSLLRHGMDAAGMTVAQAVLLRGGFETRGPVILTGASIGGQLDCTAATFDLPEAPMENRGRDPYALVADSLRVANTFFWRKVKLQRGIVHLGSAQVGGLHDDFPSWQPAFGGRPQGHPPRDLCLDGFTYDHLWGPTDAARRCDWLRRGTIWRWRFRPQAYRHLAQVLRRQGHDRAARHVLVEMEQRIAHHGARADRLRAARLWRGKARGDLGCHWIAWRSAQAWDWLFRNVTGYGYMPQRALWWLAGLVLVGTMVHVLAFHGGLMVPSSAAVLLSDPWAAAVAEAPDHPVSIWADTVAGRYHETFSALGYTLDLSLPFLDLGQEAAWGASTVTTVGAVVWVLGWAIKLAGWLVSGLGLAAAAGIVRRDRG